MCRKTSWTSPMWWCSSSLRSIPIQSLRQENTSSISEGRNTPCAHCLPQEDCLERSLLDLMLCSSPFLLRSQGTIPIWFYTGLRWRMAVHLWFCHLPIWNTHPQGLQTGQSIFQCRTPLCSSTPMSSQKSGCMGGCMWLDMCISARLMKQPGTTFQQSISPWQQ